mmetsp:Transcript_62429/g.184696  ORF Transcript_62429/g.184696 Transcript_62429/m.184696 type:complete len:437 (-) Transcript_62429:74-1384(-)
MRKVAAAFPATKADIFGSDNMRRRKVTLMTISCVILGLLAMLVLFDSSDEKSHTHRMVGTSGFRNDARGSLRFLNQDSTLSSLVQAWKNNETSVDSAKQKLWEIVISPEYINHRPSHGIVFVKTHKTGSSTVASVLHSIATSHKMITPVFEEDAQMANTWRPSKRPDILEMRTTNPSIKGAPYDIWTNHVTFDNLLLEKVVPSANGKVLSIVRDPATRTRSACDYYTTVCQCPSSKEDSSIWDKFALSDEGQKYYSRTSKGLCGTDGSSYEIVGTGLHPDKSFQENFKEVIARAKSGDFLLLVMERMLESMLVFWHEYKLHPLDVTYLSKKVRKEDVVKASETLAAESALHTMSLYDSKLHSVADELLTSKLQEIFSESSMKQAYDDLEALNDMLHDACKSSDAVPELSYWCLEKELDNVPWHKKHSKMLENNLEQ